MEVGTYHFTQVPSPRSQVTWGQFVQSHLLRAWKLGLTTSHISLVLSSKYDMNAYMATILGDDARDFVLRVESSKKLDPTLNTSLVNIFA